MPTDKTTVPTTTFGDTFTTRTDMSSDVSAVQTKGEFDYESLNRRKFANHVDFDKFYTVVKDFVLARLGFPVVRVELTDFQIQTAIDEGVSKLDYHAPWFCSQFMTFRTKAGVTIYKLPKHVISNLEYVVYKKSLLSVQQQQGTLEFDFFIKYFQDNFLFRDFHISDFLLMQMHLEQMRKILGRDGSFQVIDGQHVAIFPRPMLGGEEVIVEYRALNSETLATYFVNWIQRYALAVSKITLGEIRGKYDTIPSPGGGARLNGEALIATGQKEQEMLLEELLTEIEEPPTFDMW
jgi:hypothetical protein